MRGARAVLAAATLLLASGAAAQPAGGGPDAGPAPASGTQADVEGRARALWEAGDVAGAVKVLEDARATHPRAARLRWMLGVLYRDTGEAGKAESALRKATALDGQDALAWADLAALLEQRGSYREALAAANRAVALEPEDAGHRADRAIIRYRLGQLDAAVEDVERATRLRPDDPDLLKDHALIRLTRHAPDDAKRAVELLQRARALAPADDAIALAHSRALLAADHTKLAAAVFDVLLARQPDLAWALYGRALAAWRQGDMATARRLAERAREVLPGVFMARAHTPARFWERDAKAFLAWLDDTLAPEPPEAPVAPVAPLPSDAPRLERVSIQGDCDAARVRESLGGLDAAIARCFGQEHGRVAVTVALAGGQITRLATRHRGPSERVDACVLALVRGTRLAPTGACTVELTWHRPSAPAPPAAPPRPAAPDTHP